ncbi:MAG TPA: ATP-binding protein [Gemmatimonadaceae bacterium]|nr:ATP-binding protein [Gemmatimonadaceae bacterium]
MSERYGRLLEHAADAIFTVDETGHFTSVNLIMERAMGHRRGDLIGTHCCALLDSPQQTVANRLLQGTLDGRRLRSEVAFRDVAGRGRIGSITATPIVEHDGRVTGALCIVRDVTEERRFADELRQREKLAAVGQLVSGVAHELNNPLAGISAFAQLLDGAGPLNAEQRDAVETIQMEAKRAAKIVSSLLLFSRQRQPERSNVDLNRVLSDTLALRRFVLTTEHIEVITELEPELPHTWADPFQLQQVLLNLLVNAEHALRGRKGKRRLILRTRRRGNRIVASVIDNGPGISEEVRSRIFEPFFTTKPVGEGSGLGLAISHGIVRQHSGVLRAQSTPGEGAAFEVDLPILSESGNESRLTKAVEMAGIPRQRRFLIVDNEPAMRQALQLHLRRSGCFADAVSDAPSALALLATRTYGAIFLDLHLAEPSGESLFAELVERDPDHAGRVIFATGDLESPPAREFLQGAGRPFVGKPFALSTVAALLTQTASR